MTNAERLSLSAQDKIPQAAPGIIEWATENVVLPGSARSKHFNIDITPWLREPLERATDLTTRIVTFMKPVQSGGSVFGELLMLYWVVFSRGFFQYNWSNDKRANERWKSRVHNILKACPPVAERLAQIRYSDGEVDFGNLFFRMQGAFVDSNLDSDSIRLQINEEVHDWQKGHLKKARNRLTAVWDYKAVDISNAGDKDDQLDIEFRKGTMQHLEVLCPGCRERHIMRIHWDRRHPELGGLKYDADGCRLGTYEYNYSKLRPTIEYWFPCGRKVHNEDTRTRRQLALSSQYGDPTNEGAELIHRSYTYQAVAVDYIDWMQLIKDKHDALRARAWGDPEPWKRYKRERECIPYDSNDIPIIGTVVTLKGVKKSREGLPDPKLRLFALDRQEGQVSKGDYPHWWLVIRDIQVVNGVMRSLLVYEGRRDTDEDAVQILEEHGCQMWQGVADSGDDTSHVYALCLKYGINAIKGGREDHYTHPGGARRIFSPERPLHSMVNRDSKYPYLELPDGRGGVQRSPHPREPMFWLYSKAGIRERLHWLRKTTEWQTPSDVSEDYQAHMEAEERVQDKLPSGEVVFKWIQHKERNDLFVDECYIAMLAEMAGMTMMKKEEAGETKPDWHNAVKKV